MKVLLFGATGKLGREFTRILTTRCELLPLSSTDVNFEQTEDIESAIRATNPDVIINAAAFTAVDEAEEKKEIAFRVNAIAPKIIAMQAKKRRALLIHFSTDYVFDGLKSKPYTELDQPSPINIYGASKLCGEEEIINQQGAFFIIRTSWQYGWGGENIFTTLHKKITNDQFVFVDAKQTGSPSWNRTLASITSTVFEQSNEDIFEWGQYYKGIYHLSCKGYATRYVFAKSILKNLVCKEKHFPKILPIIISKKEARANRPTYSALDSTMFANTFKVVIPDWESDLQNCLESALKISN